jgi:hypothetical protein
VVRLEKQIWALAKKDLMIRTGDKVVIEFWATCMIDEGIDAKSYQSSLTHLESIKIPVN